MYSQRFRIGAYNQLIASIIVLGSELNTLIGLNFILFVLKYDKYTSNTEYDYNITYIQIGFGRKSNDLFESVSKEFTLLKYVLSCRNCHVCRK